MKSASRKKSSPAKRDSKVSPVKAEPNEKTPKSRKASRSLLKKKQPEIVPELDEEPVEIIKTPAGRKASTRSRTPSARSRKSIQKPEPVAEPEPMSGSIGEESEDDDFPRTPNAPITEVGVSTNVAVYECVFIMMRVCVCAL